MVGGLPTRTVGGTNARRALTTAAIVAVVAFGATVAGTAVVGAQSDGPVLSVGDASVDPGETSAVAVTLDSAPKGVAGFDVNVSVADPSVATVTNVSLGEPFDSPGGSSGVTSDGSTAVLLVADLGESVQSDASDVTFATVTVRGEADGSTAIEATVDGVDNDDGGDVEPAVENGSVTVGDVQTSDETAGSTTTSGSGPGFTKIVALFALVAGSLIAKRRA
ncbi:cohesin domain-containing protein [Halomicrobium urmianum]|uniref:cohesin domain-containing protein n=1 Tax=Halomicrobium urmianum TaxID=1586233 RepID=UPI001CD92AA5|nr:cohesin domain-containing protein [Halomicrobium urmianum]